jgi:hypothetical protein
LGGKLPVSSLGCFQDMPFISRVIVRRPALKR